MTGFDSQPGPNDVRIVQAQVCVFFYLFFLLTSLSIIYDSAAHYNELHRVNDNQQRWVSRHFEHM
jgi:hypothetical protein